MTEWQMHVRALIDLSADFENHFRRKNILSAADKPETRNGAQIRTPGKFGVGRSKPGVLGHIYPEIKGQWLNWIFLKLANGET